jgi:hypothetical protein
VPNGPAAIMSGADFQKLSNRGCNTLLIVPLEVNVDVCVSMSRFKRYYYRAFLGNSSATCTRTPRVGRQLDVLHYQRTWLACMLSGAVPRRQTRSTPPPTGVTHLLHFDAFQSAVTTGQVPMYQSLSSLQLMKYCIRNWLSGRRSVGPPIEQILLTNAQMVQCQPTAASRISPGRCSSWWL